MRLLFVEDDRNLCDSLGYQLRKEGYEVDVCHTGTEGLMLIRQAAYDLVLLDRMLPEMEGLTVLGLVRAEGITTPVILLTALGELSDRVQGLDAGADDYLVKPFAFSELAARIRSILRRPGAYRPETVFRLGALSYDPGQKRLSWEKASCILSRREGELMEFLLRSPNQILSRGQLLDRVWGPGSGVEEGNLDNYIYLLRRRLRGLSAGVEIQSVRGVGYRLRNPDDPSQEREGGPE